MQHTSSTAESLPCKLTDPEILERAFELSRIEQEIDAHGEAKKAYLETWRGQKAELVKRRKERSMEIVSRMVVREVSIQLVRDFAAKRVEERRLDTGETVRSRPMNPDELQVRLFPLDLHKPEGEPDKSVAEEFEEQARADAAALDAEASAEAAERAIATEDANGQLGFVPEIAQEMGTCSSCEQPTPMKQLEAADDNGEIVYTCPTCRSASDELEGDKPAPSSPRKRKR